MCVAHESVGRYIGTSGACIYRVPLLLLLFCLSTTRRRCYKHEQLDLPRNYITRRFSCSAPTPHPFSEHKTTAADGPAKCFHRFQYRMIKLINIKKKKKLLFLNLIYRITILNYNIHSRLLACTRGGPAK